MITARSRWQHKQIFDSIRPSAPGSWGRYVSGDPVHDLASAMGHEWLATCVPVQDVLSQGILSSSTTCGISGSSEEALHVTAIWW